MDLVDAYRRSLDPALLLLPPVRGLPLRPKALLASIVLALAQESAMDAPAWAERSYFLPQAWFPAGLESLKATAICESPLAFRRNNIFVHANFLDRV